MSPSHSHLKGEKRVNKSGKEYAPYNAGAWILSSNGRVRSLDANEHILWLLDELAHCHSAIHRLVEQGYRADIMCGWFANSDNTCPSLNAETIRRLAPVRVDFWFDVYLG
ncbi:MAG: DUF4279 domain-containing protein [Cyanobacteria bacterium HKST-UBA02]|nr:DUF4279 domain-containing protein [Cyanobacteria bacterium HKST-UBA02]